MGNWEVEDLRIQWRELRSRAYRFSISFHIRIYTKGSIGYTWSFQTKLSHDGCVICTGLVRNVFQFHPAWSIFRCSRILRGCSHIGPISSCVHVVSFVTDKMPFRHELSEMLWRDIGHPRSLWEACVNELAQGSTEFLAGMKIKQGHKVSTGSNLTSFDKSSLACHYFYLFVSTNED